MRGSELVSKKVDTKSVKCEAFIKHVLGQGSLLQLATSEGSREQASDCMRIIFELKF